MPDKKPFAEAESPAAGLASTGFPAASRRLGLFAGRFRWVICTVLFLGVTKNYMDRQVLGVLKGPLQHEFGWSEIDYGNLIFAFQTAYAVGMLSMGRLIDRLGTRVGYAIAMVFWSLASMGHALAGSITGFLAARSALGFGEAGVFPASIKCISEWFPKKERAFAMGISNAGTNIGAILTPLLVPWIALHLGWRWAFVFTGGLGFVWLILWLWIYQKPEQHPLCTNEEKGYIGSGSAEAAGRVKWLELLQKRETWAYGAGKFLVDPIWWFYLFWIPDYLQRQHGLHLTQIGLPILVIYLISDCGAIAGGWISSALLRRNYSLSSARKLAMLFCAVSVIPIAAAYRISGLWPATLLIGLAAAGHQGFASNLFTMPSDLFPSRAVASVAGIGGMAGAVGGMLIAEIVGHLLQWTGSYMIPFLIASSVYLIALLLIHLLTPQFAPAQIGSA